MVGGPAGGKRAYPKPVSAVGDDQNLHAVMMRGVRLRGSGLGAGWRVFRRHLRNASGNPRTLLWILRRTLQIIFRGELRGVLQRHRVVEDFYRAYPAWVKVADRAAEARVGRLKVQSKLWPTRPRFSVLLPVYSPNIGFLERALQAVLSQDYPDWELCIVDDASPDVTHIPWLESVTAADARVHLLRRQSNGGIAVTTNEALAQATGDFCLFIDQDDLLAKSALFDLAERVIERPAAVMVYADEDYVDEVGVRSRPMFKPDWDPEWLRTRNYVLHPVAVRTSFLREIGGLRTGLDGAQDWDLLLRIAETAHPSTIEHVAHVLYHWRVHSGSTAAGIYEKPGSAAAQERCLRESIERRGETAGVEQSSGGWRIRYALTEELPLASLVIPTRDRVDMLRRCVEGLRTRTQYAQWEAIIVDNGSTDPEALHFLASLASDRRFKVIRDEREFNYSMLCNEGVAASSGEIVVLLNNDVNPINPDWLTELVAHARRPEIGLVGAMLYYPNNTIQHAGVVLGLNGVADRPYIGYARGFRGVDSRLLAVHTVSTMVTACSAVRRCVYQTAGGMDEELLIACNDLDLCLRVAELGHRNILTPHAELYHHESATRGYHYSTAMSAQAAMDERRFREKWNGKLTRDHTYNPNLTLEGLAFSLPMPTSRGSVRAPAH
jgi:glycosyltransferase involved in cell wall biosynthesis